MPFAVLALLRWYGRFSAAGTILTAVLVTGLTVVGYIEIDRSESSTAAIGLVYFPIWFTLLVVVAYVVDLGTRHVPGASGDKAGHHAH